MRVAAVVEWVWDPASIEVDPVRGAIDWTRAVAVPGPGSLDAVELGLRLGELTVYGLGVAPVDDLLRTCLAMGAAHIAAAGSAEAVAAALAEAPPDLVLVASRAGGQGPSPLGPELAALLDLPQATGVEALRIDEDEAVVTCRRDRGVRDELAVALPAVLAVEPGIAPPRQASPAALVATLTADVPALSHVGPAGRGAVPRGTMPPRPAPPRMAEPDPRLPAEERIAAVVGGATAEAGAGRELVTGTPEEVADRIVRFLAERGFL